MQLRRVRAQFPRLLQLVQRFARAPGRGKAALPGSRADWRFRAQAPVRGGKRPPPRRGRRPRSAPTPASPTPPHRRGKRPTKLRALPPLRRFPPEPAVGPPGSRGRRPDSGVFPATAAAAARPRSLSPLCNSAAAKLLSNPGVSTPRGRRLFEHGDRRPRADCVPRRRRRAQRSPAEAPPISICRRRAGSPASRPRVRYISAARVSPR